MTSTAPTRQTRSQTRFVEATKPAPHAYNQKKRKLSIIPENDDESEAGSPLRVPSTVFTTAVKPSATIEPTSATEKATSTKTSARTTALISSERAAPACTCQRDPKTRSRYDVFSSWPVERHQAFSAAP
jgi:hypothetical protein